MHGPEARVLNATWGPKIRYRWGSTQETKAQERKRSARGISGVLVIPGPNASATLLGNVGFGGRQRNPWIPPLYGSP